MEFGVIYLTGLSDDAVYGVEIVKARDINTAYEKSRLHTFLANIVIPVTYNNVEELEQLVKLMKKSIKNKSVKLKNR